jgi:hypothetical protein
MARPLGPALFAFAFHKYKPKNTQNYIIFPVETWALTLRVERRLRVFDNRTLRHVTLCRPMGTQQQGIYGSCLARLKLFECSRQCVTSCTDDRCMVSCERTSLRHDGAHPLRTSYPVNDDKTLTSPQDSPTGFLYNPRKRNSSKLLIYR